MGLLTTNIKKTKKDIDSKQSKFTTNETLFVSTSIDILDYNAGTLIDTDEGQMQNVGLPMGKVHMFVGHSQSGKTTLAIQMANAMVEPLNGDVIVFDFERSTNDPSSRITKICNITKDDYESRFTFFNQADMTVDFVKEMIFDIVEVKKKISEKEMIDWYDLSGKTIRTYPPTVLIIDSVSTMRNSELLDNPKLDSNMVAASIAKTNGNFLTSIQHMLEAYNITIFGIGHITTKITINPYAEKKVQLPGLSDDEHIPGGNKFIFMSSYLIKLKAGREFKDDKDLGIKGRIVNAKWLKTRSGYNATTIPLFFHSVVGFSNVLTNYYYLKENDFLKGGGRGGYNLPNLPEVKFAQKDFYKTYFNNEAFQQAFDELIEQSYTKIIEAKSDDGLGDNTSSNDDSLDDEFDD